MNHKTRKCLALYALVFQCALFNVHAQSFTEGTDFPGTGTGPAFTVAGPSITIAGTLNTPGDGQDRFQITIPAGCTVTGASWTITDTANLSVNGFAQFGLNNQEPIPPQNGSFANGPFLIPFPVTAGTYDCIMGVNIAANDVWTMTFYTSCTSGIATVNFAEEITAYPNPASDKLFFSDENTSGTFTLTNSLGQVVKTEILAPGEARNGISIADLAEGVYYYMLVSEEKKLSGKVVILH